MRLSRETAVSTLKTQVVGATEARVAELEVALARETRISVALREVGLAIGSTLDLDQLLELVLEKLTEALEAERATLYLLDEANDELVSRIVQGDEVQSIRLKVSEGAGGIAGHVARTGRSMHVRDPYADPRFDPAWDLLSGYRTRSILAAPMRNHLGRTIGVIQVLNKKRGEFSEVDAVILAALATQAAISIDNSRLFLSLNQRNMQLLDTKEQLEHRVRDLKLLFDLESAMGRATSLEELFLAVLGQATRATRARAGAVLLREDPAGPLALHTMDAKHRRLRRFPLREGQGLIGWAMKRGEVLLSNDARRDARLDPTVEDLVGFEAESALAAPFEGEDGEPMGAIALYNKRHGGFDEEDRALLVLVAANASTSIRLQLARETREREERLTTIGRLLSGVMHDLRSPLTVIRSAVEMMQGTKGAEARGEYAATVYRQFEQITHMQREVLEFARGEKSLLLRKVYVKTFFETLEAELATELARSGVALVLDLQDRGTARFDEGKIARLVHNLARNAAEAMGPKGGTFTIGVTRDPDGKVARDKERDRPSRPAASSAIGSVAREAGNEAERALVLTFTDTGPGIPKEIEHRLFQSFVTSGKKGGTGLGLAIVKKIVDEHGGSVSVHSTPEGATFRIRLPQPRVRARESMLPPAAKSARPSPAPSESPSRPRLKAGPAARATKKRRALG